MPQLDWDFVLRFLNITLIDMALSGDNAIVIGMAAAALPQAKRKFALVLGGVLAIVLRIVLTGAASLLLRIPFLSVVGGLALVWVVWRLLKTNDGAEESETRQAGSLREAIILILTADFMMSLDNVLAVAGSAHGNLFLLIAGLLISMPLLIVAGGAISALIDKARWILYIGAAAISFTAARMVLEDEWVSRHVSVGGSLGTFLVSLAFGVLLPLGMVFVPRLVSGAAAAESDAE